MRIQQTFAISLFFHLIFSLQAQGYTVNHMVFEKNASSAFADLSDNFQTDKMGIIKNDGIGDCPPDEKYCVGIIIFKDGSLYNGEISYGKPNGKGFMKWPDGSYYIGNFVQGERDGYGEFEFGNGDHYEGAWSNNQMNGYGVFIWANGAEYIGDFKNNKMHGTGSVVLENNEGYSGEWNNNRPDGLGSFRQNNGCTYTGFVKNGLREGEGKLIWEKGDTIFGNWTAGKFDGEVRFLFKNGDQLMTEWTNGNITAQSSYITNMGKSISGDFKDIEEMMVFNSFENDFASNIQFTYYLIGLEYDTNYQFKEASEYFQMALNVDNDEQNLAESINKSLRGVKEKQNSGWVKLNKE